MTRGALTKFELDVLLLAHEGKSNRQIAADTGTPFNCIITTLSNIKRKGYRLPDHRPRDATAEQAHRVLGRRGNKTYSAAPRFTVTGVKASTGERFTVTSDTREFAAAHLAAMVGVCDG